ESPIIALGELKKNLEKKIERDLQEFKIKPELIHEFKNEFDTKINDILFQSEYNSIKNKEQITDNYNSWYIRPGYFPIQKNRLVDMTIDSYNNYYSYYIDSLIEKIQRGISETFFYARKEKYLFKPNDVIKAIDKI